MGLIAGLTAKEALLFPVGEVYDLFNRYVKIKAGKNGKNHFD